MGIENISGVPYNPRFFYFKSLLDRRPEIRQQLNSGGSTTSFFGGEKFDEQAFMNQTKASLELLSSMASFNRENEIRLIQEKIIPLAETFNNGKYKDLANCINGDKIDYIKFMSLIKLLEDDSQEALSELEDFYDKTKEFSDLATDIIGNMDYTTIKQRRNQVSAIVRATATRDLETDIARRMVALNQYNKSRKNDINDELFNALNANILSMIEGGQTTIEIPAADNAYQTEMLNYIYMLCTQRAKKMNEDKQNIRESLLNFLNTKQDDETMELLQRRSDQLLKNMEVLQSEGEAFERKINGISDKIYVGKNGELAGFTKANRNKLNSLISDKKALAAATNKTMTVTIQAGGTTITKEIDATARTKTNKQQYINTILSDLFSEEERKNLSQQEIADRLNGLMKQAEQRKETITVASEHRSGTVLGNITGAVVDKVIGAANGKNDASLVSVGKATISSSAHSTINDATYLKGLNIISDTFSKMTDEFPNIYKFYLNEDVGPGEKKRNENTFDIIAQTKAHAKMTQIALDEIRKEFKDLNLKINDVSDIFQVDDSAKFAETFMLPEGGFAGGSLGSDVESQINNINNMMMMGGLTPLDGERLMSMVLNSGEGMIGANARPALENYFTSIGSMLMFQSGGNALKQWKAQIDNASHKDTTKIHIYTFGPMYAPESFILQQTYDSLLECVNILEEEASTRGSRVRIYNPVTEKDMVRDANGKPDWAATARENYKKVKLDMVLMGGFLDTMERMLDTMNNAIKG